MRIKKFKNNEYIITEGTWVRNPFSSINPLDINSISKNELPLIMDNEKKNSIIPHMEIDEQSNSSIENVIIVSDGYEWEERQKILASLPNAKFKIFGVNGSLAKWNMVGSLSELKRTMAFYVVNNPYPECKSFLPTRHKYYPNLVASTRTCSDFLKAYKNQPYIYSPTPDENYSGMCQSMVTFDDYRNPVCAAVSLAVFNGAKKILLFCCDASFKDDRPGSKQMTNGLRQYEQQIKCQKVLDAQFFWLKKAGIKLGDCSSGIEFKNAEYIKIEGIDSFFK